MVDSGPVLCWRRGRGRRDRRRDEIPRAGCGNVQLALIVPTGMGIVDGYGGEGLMYRVYLTFYC